jgi:hypothetical protein
MNHQGDAKYSMVSNQIDNYTGAVLEVKLYQRSYNIGMNALVSQINQYWVLYVPKPKYDAFHKNL